MRTGGLGLSLLDECIITEEISYGCTGIGTAIAACCKYVCLSIPVCYSLFLQTAPVLLGGSHELKKKYLGRLTEQPLAAVSGYTGQHH